MKDIKMDLIGFYMHKGAQNQLEGEISILSDGTFKGNIFDYGSRPLRKEIKGHIINDKGINKLIFLESPENQNLSNLLYKLENLDSSQISGNYRGHWEALPYNIEYNPDCKGFLAQIDNSVVGIGDEAKIFLSPKVSQE